MEEYNPKERLIVHKIAIVVQIFVLIFAFIYPSKNASKEAKNQKIVNTTAAAAAAAAAEAKAGTNKYGVTGGTYQATIDGKPIDDIVKDRTETEKIAAMAKRLNNSETRFTDPRDSKKYKTAIIGNQTWMAENLNYNASGSKCYDNKPANCSKYGRLYDWKTAMKACPKGWHLPNDDEWQILVDFAGGDKIAGKVLKAANGWNNNGNGTDAFNFSALPGGVGVSDGNFGDVGYYGYWWSASEDYSDGAYYRSMGYGNEHADGFSYGVKSFLYSVRCLQD